ncbi:MULTISPECIES: glycosyltransferase [Brucella]|uniref:glycosyltransferase family protein n=1 Tax=Brucella/Ochrobactrum group TaxID=2826938 RepID=UPI001FCF1D22|nr:MULTISPECIES: glycosyltransferase [Brucella]MDX4072264.1 glycosyltransferase [Brucella sp. NBRC 113783]
MAAKQMRHSTTSPRVLFYVQHLLGIGHLARASRIARALTQDGFDVTVVTGGMPVSGFPGPEVNHVALPAIASGDAGFSGLADAFGNPVTEEFKAERRDKLLATFRDVRPDIVIIEAFPFGRRQVRFELIPLLDEISRMTQRPLVLTSLRDILQERAKPGRNEESIALVQRYFDHVLVHGDPQFARLEDSFPLHADIADKVIYTGLVAAPAPSPPSGTFDIVVSAGGGAVGALLIRAALEASKRLSPDLSWCIVTGPNLQQSDFDEITAEAPNNARIFRFLQNFPSLLLDARLSVSQAGYNTVCDILRADCKALLIPFTAGGETEQTARARHLQKLGLASVLTEDELSVDSMTDAIAKALAAPRLPAHNLDLDGAHRTAEILHGLLAAR